MRLVHVVHCLLLLRPFGGTEDDAAQEPKSSRMLVNVGPKGSLSVQRGHSEPSAREHSQERRTELASAQPWDWPQDSKLEVDTRSGDLDRWSEAATEQDDVHLALHTSIAEQAVGQPSRRSMVRQERKHRARPDSGVQALIQRSDQASHELCRSQVRSAGIDDGDYVHFKLDGKTVSPGSGQGFNILVPTADWADVDEFHVFDTSLPGDAAGQRMANFLNRLEDGQCIMVGVKGDAAGSVESEALLALEKFGAAKAFEICQRCSYAFIGCKPSEKVLEQVKPRYKGSTAWLCPRKCEWDEWGKWSECSQDCEGGVERRHRIKLEEGEPGGWPCDGHEEEEKDCGHGPCPDNASYFGAYHADAMPHGLARPLLLVILCLFSY